MALTVANSLQVEHVDWAQLDTILLDMDGTLLDLAFDNHFWGTVIPEQWGRRYGLDLQSSQQRLAPIFSKEQGKLNWYCLDFWGQTLELDIPSIKSAYTDGIRWRPLAETFLSRLQASHLDVVLITNAHPITLEIKAAKLPLEKWFDKIVSSHTYGAPKETPDFWRELIADRPFEPHRTLFIDDGEHVLDSACSFGVAHLITLRQPDSSLPPRKLTRHPSILHFDEIMQGLPPFD